MEDVTINSDIIEGEIDAPSDRTRIINQILDASMNEQQGSGDDDENLKNENNLSGEQEGDKNVIIDPLVDAMPSSSLINKERKGEQEGLSKEAGKGAEQDSASSTQRRAPDAVLALISPSSTKLPSYVPYTQEEMLISACIPAQEDETNTSGETTRAGNKTKFEGYWATRNELVGGSEGIGIPTNALPSPSGLHRHEATVLSPPGAFAVQPSLDLRRSRDDDLERETTRTNSATVPDAGGGGAAAEAELLSLPQAEEVDLEAAEAISSQREKQQRCRYLTWIGWMSLFLSLVLGTTIGILLSSSSGGEDDIPTSESEKEDRLTQNSSAPLLSLEEYMLSLLPSATVQRIRRSNTSPPARALDWLLQDPLVVEGQEQPRPHVYSDHRLVQRFALATLFYSTQGHQWVNNDNWLSYETHECEWYAWDGHEVNVNLSAYVEFPDPITPCSPMVKFDYDRNPEQGIYRHLFLPKNNLRGSFPEEVYLLTHLESVMTYSNQLDGTVSTGVGKLSKLKVFTIFDNSLTGTLPSQLGMPSNMTNLNCFSNPRLGGAIPSELGLLSNMKYLHSWDNAFTGTVPTELGLMTSLKDFYFINNELTGPLPSELGLMSAVTSLQIEFNRLSGPIPSELGKLSNVLWMFLNDNFLSGTIPSELGGLWSLRTLDLNNNKLTGTIPNEIGWLHHNSTLGSLVILNVSTNAQLSGTIPEDLCALDEFGVQCSNLLCGCQCSCAEE